MAPKVLLLQARKPEDPMRAHELNCFVESTGLEHEHFAVHDLLEGPPAVELVRGHDAVMVGGSGDFYVSKQDLPAFDRFQGFLQDLVGLAKPTFASCFGYQSLVQALGGEIVYDPENTEVGTYELTLSPEAQDDPLFGAMPERFWAQMGHKDRAMVHPRGMATLASSALSPNQALRIPGAPIWATQFHPELDGKTNLERYMHYLEGYAAYLPDSERQAAADRFHESPEASGLLGRFIQIVFG